MVAAFPLAKLGAVVVKQISKPLAKVIQERAKQNYVFRTYLCMPPAQFYHWCEVRTRMWVMGLGRSAEVPKLNEAMAIELGANMLGEGVILTVAAAAVVAEYNRSSKKEEAHELKQQERLRRLERELQELQLTTEQQDAQLRQLSRRLMALDLPPAGTALPSGAATSSGVVPSVKAAAPVAAAGRLDAALREAHDRIRGS